MFDYSSTDTSELPRFDADIVHESASLKASKGQPIITVDIPSPSFGDSIIDDTHSIEILTAEPVVISWNNLAYTVDVPKKAVLDKKQAKKIPISIAPPRTALPLSKTEIEMIESKKMADANKLLRRDSFTGLLTSGTPDIDGKRTLITNMYGYAKPGMFISLIGASGSGKTTLLDVLAGKKTGGDILNPPLINGKLRDSSFSRIAGYVEQFDSHDETATIREAIEFSATLRLPGGMPYDVKMKKVESVIRIGNYERGGVSPELRKKVTIAVELVMDPGLLFLDEPTTGLDSAGALAVMHAVRRLSKKISVICTVHQPSMEIVNCFTHMILLNKWEGRVAYFGSVTNMPGYFHQVGLGECPSGKNIAEYSLEQLRISEKEGQSC
jgi:ABC-type multidrug transport system ATPase subunit